MEKVKTIKEDLIFCLRKHEASLDEGMASLLALVLEALDINEFSTSEVKDYFQIIINNYHKMREDRINPL